MENEIKRVYDPSDIQKILGLGRTKVYQWLDEIYRKQNYFRVIKIGRTYKIPKESFDKWLEKEDEFNG